MSDLEQYPSSVEVEPSKAIESSEANSETKKGKPWLWLILLITVLVYLEPVLKSEFLNWDDDLYLTENEPIKQVDGFSQIWIQQSMPNPYPITFSVIRLQYLLFGENAVPFHMVNLFLHLLNIILFWMVLHSLRLKIPLKVFAVSLYALHPVQVETVMWMSEVKNLLCASFYWLSFLCFFRFLEEKGKAKIGFYLLLLFCFFCSLLSKSMSVTLPVTFTLWILLFRVSPVRSHLLWIFPLWGVSLFFGLLSIENEARLYKERARADRPITSMPVEERFAHAVNAYIFYTTKFIWPKTLTCVYPNNWYLPRGTWGQRFALCAFFLLISFLFYWGWRSKEKDTRLFFFCLLNYGLVASVTSGFFYTTYLSISLFADRYNYHPLPFLLIALGLLFSWQWKLLSKKKKEWCTFLGAVLLFLFCSQTYLYALVWTNSIRLWSHAYSINPKHRSITFNLASAYLEAKEWESAAHFYEQTLKYHPEHYRAHNDYGVLLQQFGHYEKALSHFLRSYEAHPGKTEPLLNIGIIHFRLGNFEEAKRYLNRCVFPERTTPGVYLALGNVYFETQEYKEAKEHYHKSIQEGTKAAYCFSKLAWIEDNEKNTEEAERYFQKALSLEPSIVNVWLNFNLFYYHQKEYKKALDVLRKAKRFFASQKGREALINSIKIEQELVGFLLLCPDTEIQSVEQAEALAQQLCQRTRGTPFFATALDLLAGVWAHQGQFLKAISLMNEALSSLEKSSPFYLKIKERENRLRAGVFLFD